MPRPPPEVRLEPISHADLPLFRSGLQDAFGAGVAEAFGSLPDEPIPSDDDIDETVGSPGAVAYHMIAGGERVGGAVVVLDELTQRNSLAFFFVSPQLHGHGIGYRAWLEIEKIHAGTKVWETHTPYFDKRNIHFYVNKCGFNVVEFYNRHHPDPHQPSIGAPASEEDADCMFRFEKEMDVP